jgi:drug/metabolite transporter (DMT)-like permease
MYALFASVFTVGKVALDVSGPFFLTGVRMLAAGIVLLAYVRIRHPEEFRIPFRLWPLLFWVGLFNVFITNAFEFWGLQYMLSSKTCLIYSLSPFAAVFLSYLFLGETMSPFKWLGMAIGVAGFIPLFAGPWINEGVEATSVLENWAEIALTISAITAVIGWIFVKKLTVGEKYSGVMVNAVSFVIGAVLCFIVSGFTEAWDPFPVTEWNTFWLSVAYIAVIHNIICYNIYALSLKKFTVTFMAFAGLSNPLFTAIYGWYFLNEPLTLPFFVALGGAGIGLGLFYREERKSMWATASTCIVSLMVLQSCETVVDKPAAQYVQIVDRTYRPLYQSLLPEGWSKEDPLPDSGLADTMKPIATMQVEDITITVHNFPSSSLEQRIPPQAQITRWEKQFTTLDEDTIAIQSVGHSGFLGLQFEASGIVKGQEVATLAWIFQLAPEHYYALDATHPNDMQRKADWTIKAVGSKESIEKHKQSILLFAHSFELIDEIP